jgi:very-short-patch-repair endonuclease
MRDRLITADQLRTSAWLRLRQDVYADARLERDHRLACQAMALRLPEGIVIAGTSAAYLHGVEFAAGFTDPVHVIVPPPIRAGGQRGVRLHVVAPRPGDTLVGGSAFRCTTPARTAWDLASWQPVDQAVSIIDALLGRDLVVIEQLDRLVAERTHERGSRLAARAFGLADGRAQSPAESLLRVRLVLAGLPRPKVQHPVRLESGRLVHPDLAWPEFMVAVEYDGHWHADVNQLHLDRRRLNGLINAGWLVLHVTSQRMYRDFGAVVREVRAALAQRGWRS